MDYNDMSKEELIKYIEELKKERAFSEEDRFLLRILDNSPFTIWASDRNCTIKFWEGQCESLYGYKKEKAIGKDFVSLFVAEDEQKAAREDQIKIIDSGEVFHNIANDHAKNGNTLRLLTNCWRMKAPNSDEYWNVEMGLIIDFFNQELERLEEIVSESRSYKARTTQFIELTKQARRQYTESRKNFYKDIRDSRSQAIRAKKANEFAKIEEPVKKKVDELDERLSNLIEEYTRLVQRSGSSEKCEELTDAFKDKYYEFLGEFDDEVINFSKNALEFTSDGTAIGRNQVLKEAADVYGRHYSAASNLKININRQIDSIKSQLVMKKESSILKYYTDLSDRVEMIIQSLASIQDKVYEDIGQATNYKSVMNIRSTMLEKYYEKEKELELVEYDFKKPCSEDYEKVI